MPYQNGAYCTVDSPRKRPHVTLLLRFPVSIAAAAAAAAAAAVRFLWWRVGWARVTRMLLTRPQWT